MIQQTLRQLLQIAHQNGQTARGVGTFQVRRSVAHHPYCFIRGNSRAVESPEDRIRCRFVAQAVPRAYCSRDPALPTEMGKLRPEIVAHLVAHDGDVAAELMTAGQQGSGAGQRLELLAPHPIGRLDFDDVHVPSEHVLGEVDRGFHVAMRTLDIFRPSVGAFAIGMGQAGKVGAPKGMATAGLVLSILAIVWGPVWNWYFVLPAAAREAEQKAKELRDELNKKR